MKTKSLKNILKNQKKKIINEERKVNEELYRRIKLNNILKETKTFQKKQEEVLIY